MATFAEYSSNNMASNTTSDFPLFAYNEMWNDQNYQSYPDQSYMDTTSFDGYPSMPAYNQPNQYAYGSHATFQQKPHGHGDAYTSPSHSAAPSFDLQQPPVLSSTSDSGASAPSTISSAMGSPSIQPQATNAWMPQNNMGMLPDIVHPDSLSHDIFASTSFDIETIPVTDKGCVGELNAISSFQRPQSAFPFNPSINRVPTYPARSTAISAQEVSSTQAPTAMPGASNALATNLPLAITPPDRDSMSPNDNFFKSPTTPASATSPVLERVKGKRKSSFVHNALKRPRGSSPLTQAMSYSEADLPARPHAPLPTFPSPFFSQSGGYFVPPLESSCPFPFLFSFLSFLISFMTERRGPWLTSAHQTLLSSNPFRPTNILATNFPKHSLCNHRRT